MTGSHCDAIPLAGAYDGTLGVLGGIAAVRALRAAGYRPAKPIEVLFFTSEEPTRFSLGCIGRFAPPAAECRRARLILCSASQGKVDGPVARLSRQHASTLRLWLELDARVRLGSGSCHALPASAAAGHGAPVGLTMPHACSRGMCGQLTPAILDKNLDENGTSFQAAATAAGYGGASHKVRHHLDVCADECRGCRA